MTVKDFYTQIGGNYEMAMVTFVSEDRLRKFLDKYTQDPSYQRLCTAAEAGDIREAFEAVHAMKGITGMFYMTRIYDAVFALVEQLRPQNAPMDPAMFETVKKEQQLVLAAIEELGK